MSSDVVKLNYSVKETAEALGIGRTACYALIARGELPSIVIEGRRLVRVRDLEAWNEAQSDPRVESARRAS